MLEHIISTRKHSKIKLYVEMRPPVGLSKSPSLNIACGENPEAVWEEPANDAPHNLVLELGEIPTAADIFAANTVHLLVGHLSSYSESRRDHLLFHVLGWCIISRSVTVTRVEIRLISNLNGVKYYPSVFDSGGGKSFHNCPGFHVGGS